MQYRDGTSGPFSPWTHNGHGTTTTITSLTADTDYQVQVLARSPEGESLWSEHVDARTSANRAPTFNEGTSATRSLAENTTGTNDVGNPVTARDNDGGTPEYSLAGADAARFTIDAANGQLQTVSGTTYDYEEKSRYEVIVRVEDGQGGSNTIAVTINLTDLQEPPDTPSAPGVSAASSTSLEVTWDEPDNPGPDINDYDVQYRPRDTGGFRSWNHTGAERTAIIPRLIPDSTYQVQVRARNPEGASDWSEPGTGTTSPNGLPVFADGSSASRSLDENITGAQNVGDPVSATDPENTPLAYSHGGADADAFTVDTRSGQLHTKSGQTWDHESKSNYSVSVKAVDGHKGERMIPVFIELNDLNEPPVFTSGSAFDAAENQTFAGRVAAEDPDGADNVTGYTVTGGADRDRLGVDSGGNLSFLEAPDFESPSDAGGNRQYNVQVTATGGTGGRALTAQQSIRITLTDENEPPVFTSADTFRVRENTRVAGRVTARDVDAADAVTGYAVTGGAERDEFEIAGTNQLRFRDDDDPDFERPDDSGGNNEYLAQVTATGGADPRDLTASRTVVVLVEDVNEPPGRPDPPAVSDTTESSLTVSWDEPANTGPVITNYHVQYRRSGSYVPLADSGSARSRTLTGLRSGSTYQVQVQAKNDEGTGPWSNPGSGTTLTAPTVSSVAFTSTTTADQSYTYKLNDTLDVTLTFTEAVNIRGAPQIDLTIGANVRQADYEYGLPASNQFLFQYVVQADDEDTDGASINENGLKLNGGGISLFKNINGRAHFIHAELLHPAVGNQFSHRVDGRAPTLTEAEVKADELVLTYVERIDAASKPAPADFAVTVGDSSRGVTLVEMATSEVVLTLASEVTPGQTVTLAYTPGTNPIRDLAGNPAGALVSLGAENQTPADNVCTRTAQVRDEIVRLTPASSCGLVTPEQLANIEELFLFSEGISALKAGDFAGLTGLEILELGENRISSLPAGLFADLGSLVALSLAENSITSLGANAFSGLTALEDLQLYGGSIASLDANAFSGLTALVTLDLSHNSLTTLPANGFSALTSLEDLVLDYNSLAGLGAQTFAGLTALTELDLGGNDLGDLDAGLLSAPTALANLYMSEAGVTGLPANGFSGLSALEALFLDGNDLGDLDANAFSGLWTLEFLKLTAAGVTALPATVFSGLTALKDLRLDDNSPGTLDAGLLSGLTGLEGLDLSHCGLTAIPGNLFSGLTALEILDLSHNDLSSLDAGLLSGLTSLRRLSLSENDLTALPANLLSGLTELTWFYVRANKLSTLPDGLFSGLTALTRIRLEDNTVDPLPVDLSLEAAGSRFRARAHTAAPFELILPLRPANGEIDGGEETITILQGSIRSDFLPVSRTSGTTRAVTVDLGALPGLPASDSGYVFVRSGDLPLEVISAEPGVEIYPDELLMPEGESDTYAVVLTSRPAADVTVAVNVSTGADVTVTPSPLTFTDVDWNTPQTVTVSSSVDSDSDDDEVTLTHTVSGGYSGVTADNVKIDITETAVTANRAPFFATTSFNVEENETGVATLVATDSDFRDYVIGYEITGGTDRAQFRITNRGKLSFAELPDYERPAGSSNRYVVNVTATSGIGTRERTREQRIRVSVTDVDEPPGPPQAPRLVVPFISSRVLAVTPGRRPPANTGPDITAWEVQYRVKNSGDDFAGYTPDPEPDWTEPDWVVLIRNLNRATTYEVRVGAKNDEGDGEWSPSAEIEIPNESPVVEVSIDDVTLPAGGAVEVVSVDDAFDDPDGDDLEFTASSGNPAAAAVRVSGGEVLVEPKAVGSATISVTASDPWGGTASTTFGAEVRTPTLSAPTLTLGGDLFTIEFSDDFAAGETRAYEVRIRQKEPIGNWATGCFAVTNTGSSPATITLTRQDLVSGYFEAGSTYEADYGYVGTECGGSLRGVRSVTAEATVPGTPAFDIEIVYVGGRPARRVESAFAAAVARWERIIARDVPNHRPSRTIRRVLARLFPGVTAPEVVDDLVIYVEVVPIDGPGGTLGTAGWISFRTPSLLPFFSRMVLDAADLGDMTDRELRDLVLHETGHTLGFGLSGWRRKNLLHDPSLDERNEPIVPAPDTYFSGARAIAAFDAAGGSSYTGAKVPVENARGGSGSQDSHWRETVLGNELMTPRVGAARTHPLSAITIQSMADIGYVVDVTQAEAFTLPSASKIASASEGLILHNCVVTHPEAGPDKAEPIVLNLRRVPEGE